MLKKLQISFFSYNSRAKANGDVPIYCRIALDNDNNRFSTGSFIALKDWDSIKQKEKGKTAIAESLNIHLEQIRSKLLNIETKLIIEMADNYILNDIFYIFKNGEIDNSPTLLKLFKERLDKMEKLVGSEYTVRTFRKFKEVYQHTQDYVKHSYNLQDIPFKKLDFKFIQDFQEYLLIQKKHKPITVNKIVQRVNQIVLLAVKYKYIAEHPFKG